MKIVLLAEHVLMNVLSKLYLKATSTKLTRIYAPTVVLVPMFARLRQFTPLNSIMSSRNRGAEKPLFYWGLYLAFSSISWTFTFSISDSSVASLFSAMYDSTIRKPIHTAALPGDSFVK